MAHPGALGEKKKHPCGIIDYSHTSEILQPSRIILKMPPRLLSQQKSLGSKGRSKQGRAALINKRPRWLRSDSVSTATLVLPPQSRHGAPSAPHQTGRPHRSVGAFSPTPFSSGAHPTPTRAVDSLVLLPDHRPEARHVAAVRRPGLAFLLDLVWPR